MTFSSSFSYSIPYAGLPDIKVTRFNGLRLIRIRKFNRHLEGGWDLYHHRCCSVHKLQTLDVCLSRNNSRQLRQAFGGLMAAATASSSSTINSWNHDVFLSFRGPDTRNNFTGHLYQALREKGVNVFIDNELQRGEVITSELLRVIEGSRISIVVLSEKYSSSSFCLDEAVKIHECKESKGQIVLPVFYHVDPTDVEEQTGTFGEELAQLEAQLKLNYWNNNNEGASTNMDRLQERLQEWRLALTEFATLSGWHLKKGDHEATAIQRIVKMVSKQLDRTPLHVEEHPVGLDSRVNRILKKLNLESNDVRMLGLYGMGGVGKTTTAKAIYNSCASQFGFDGSCFLLNVRENSKKYDLSELQETLLLEILGDEKHLKGNFEKGIQLIKERLGGKKVVIVIDDVDHIEQLEKLVGGLKWFGAGSRIIITTRNSYLLKLHGVTTVHEIKGLGDVEAMELFSWHAFKEPQPSEAYIELSRCVVRYAQGLPLALKVLGSSLYGRDIPMWEEVLKKLKQCPNDEITDILKVSYDGLDSEEKAIFLDIACFLKGKNKDEVIECLDACGFRANFDLQRLIEKSLVSVDRRETVQMHDLLQDMGTQIAHEESSRLCIRKPEDIRLFLENKRPNDIEGVLLDFHGEEEVPLDMLEESTNVRILIIRNGRFTRMPKSLPDRIRWLEWHNFRILMIRNGRFTRMPKSLPDSIRWLEWHNCSLKSISPGFLPANLFVLEMPWSEIVHFEKAFMVESKAKKLMNLTRLSFYACTYLREIGDFSAMPNLEELNLSFCEKLEKIDKSIGNLKKLECIWLNSCRSLVSLPNLEGNERLKRLHLRDCLELEKLPNLPATLEDLQVSGSGLKEIPSSIENLTTISHLDVSYCENLVSISSSIYRLPHLSTLHIRNCSKLTKFPEAESSMTSSSLFPRLNELNLSGTDIVTLPTCIFRFNRLERLILENCKWLVEIPELPRSVKLVNARNCKSLERFLHFHGTFEGRFLNCHKLAENEKERSRQVIFENLSLASIQGDGEGSFIILPGNEIPEWFDHAIDIEGNVSSFCFKVPPPVINDNLIGVTCCVIFQGNQVVMPDVYDISIEFHINGCYWSAISMFSELESEHMWLSINKLDGNLREMLEAGEVSCEFNWRSLGDGIVYKRVGVHFMYKNQL